MVYSDANADSTGSLAQIQITNGDKRHGVEIILNNFSHEKLEVKRIGDDGLVAFSMVAEF